MVTSLLVAPAIAEIAMMAVSIMVPIPIVVSIMAPIILIEAVIVVVELLPATGRDPMFICRGWRAFAAHSAAPSAFRLRRNSGMVPG
jgi:hypothetical protein